MKIVGLKGENIKRIRAVQITPEGNLVVIGGQNEQGKSSVLDLILMGLGGKGAICPEPVRKGEKKGFSEIDLGDLLVKRTFTSTGGGTLTVSNKDGATYKSPQTMLDALVGPISFDPLAFSRMRPADQAATLQTLLGDKFTASLAELDDKIKQTFDARAEVNRDIKRLGAPTEVEPAERVDVSKIIAEKEAITAFNREQDSREYLRKDVAEDGQRIKARITKLESELAEAKEELAQITEHYKKLPKPELHKPLDEVNSKLASVDETNRQAAAYEAYQLHTTEIKAMNEKSQGLTDALESLRRDRLSLLSKAKFPVDGLGLEDGRVTFEGLPFEQASQARQLEVSVAMGLAANPKLSVLLIRDGSLLDDAHLATIAKMAKEADAQVWLERVGEGEECSIIIEDGMVKG
jgi:hypothetical protein